MAAGAVRVMCAEVFMFASLSRGDGLAITRLGRVQFVVDRLHVGGGAVHGVVGIAGAQVQRGDGFVDRAHGIEVFLMKCCS